jgi:cytochrome c-type biogenesis protein CcmI
VTAFTFATAVIALLAALFVAWPLWRRGDHAASLLPLPPDPRAQLLEEKEALYRALRELDFEHEAGHLSDDDYASLRDRYETRAGHLLGELDALTTSDAGPPPERGRQPTARVPWTRRPITVAVAGVALLVFGIMLGLGIARHSEPDQQAARPMGGPALGDSAAGPTTGAAVPSAANAPKGPLTPEMLQGMLAAARASLQAGRYGEAIAAYQAVLKRDHRNVDALTHLGLIVAIGGHADTALETLDRALAIDPNYAPALLYRGQVLYEVKRDYAGAAKSWEKFMVLVPSGEEHDRVAALVKEAHLRSRTP